MIINFLNFRNNDITVRVYTDLFSVRGYEHGVESTKVLRLKDRSSRVIMKFLAIFSAEK